MVHDEIAVLLADEAETRCHGIFVVVVAEKQSEDIENDKQIEGQHVKTSQTGNGEK